MTNTQQKMLNGARRYAAADRSDPFALARCMSGIKHGLCDPYVDKNGNTIDCHYDARETTKTCALPLGITFRDGSSEYKVRDFISMVRP